MTSFSTRRWTGFRVRTGNQAYDKLAVNPVSQLANHPGLPWVHPERDPIAAFGKACRLN